MVAGERAGPNMKAITGALAVALVALAHHACDWHVVELFVR